MDLHPILGPTFNWITPALTEWTIKIPVILAVYMRHPLFGACVSQLLPSDSMKPMN